MTLKVSEQTTAARGGFTLLEVLLSVLLMSILLAGIVALIRPMAQQVARTRLQFNPAPHQAALDRALALIREDFLHAHACRITENGWELAGYAGMDSDRFTPDHRPVLLLYTVEYFNQTPCLTRRQTRLDSLSNLDTHRQIVLTGLTTLELSETPGGALPTDPFPPHRTEVPAPMEPDIFRNSPARRAALGAWRPVRGPWFLTLKDAQQNALISGARLDTRIR